jgi:hypothetical protein
MRIYKKTPVGAPCRNRESSWCVVQGRCEAFLDVATRGVVGGAKRLTTDSLDGILARTARRTSPCRRLCGIVEVYVKTYFTYILLEELN